MVQTETSTSAAAVPEVIRKRTNALRNLQLKMNEVEAKLSEENHKLECKYAKLFEPIYAQREKIINGEYEPTEEEATWNYKTSEDEHDDEEVGATVTKKQKKDDKDVRGLPDFWLKTFRSNTLLSGVVSECDEPVLKYLRDVRVKMNDAKIGYTIEFHFNDNEFFTNKVLTKTYELNTEPNKENPLSGHVSPLAKCLGTEIDWKAGKNVIENMKKKQQTQGKGSGSSSKKDEDEDEDEETGSFFTYFATRTENGVNPLVSNEKAAITDVAMLAQVLQEFELDYELGNTLKDLIVPKAVLFFTGEMREDEEEDEFFDEDDDEDEDDEDDDEDDDDEDESEEEQQPKKKKSSK